MRVKVSFLLLFVSFVMGAQPYPQNYFAAPLNIPLATSGTFGELRGNHFHAGVDLKTQGREGLPVLAAAEGHVVRIKVSAYGYGNALYIAHPNGYTTVYAHLKEFAPDIAAWVKKQQYAKKSFSVNLYPPAQKFAFAKGDEIAKSGNSGGSGGPHLHFEIRDSRTQETLNPALFGLPIADHKKPKIVSLYAKPLSPDGRINGENTKKTIKLTHLGNSIYSGKLQASGTFGLILYTYDSQDLSHNKNGIYSLEQRVNDTTTYRFEIDKFAFNKTRYINAHMDFPLYKSSRKLAHRCYILPGNKLENYSHVQNYGRITIAPGETKNVQLLVTDNWQNQSEINLTITGVEANPIATQSVSKLAYNTDNTIKTEYVKVFIPRGTLYEDTEVKLTKKYGCKNCASATYTVGNREIPAQKRYQLSMHKSALQTTKKLVWATVDKNGKGSGLTTTWQGDWLVAKPKVFGTFAVMQDTTAPEVRVQNFANGKIVSQGEKITAIASDNLSGITQYKAKVNNQWVLLEHDAKQNKYWYTFDENLEAGDHVITLIFTDEVGNTTTFQSVFTYRN